MLNLACENLTTATIQAHPLYAARTAVPEARLEFHVTVEKDEQGAFRLTIPFPEQQKRAAVRAELIRLS